MTDDNESTTNTSRNLGSWTINQRISDSWTCHTAILYNCSRRFWTVEPQCSEDLHAFKCTLKTLLLTYWVATETRTMFTQKTLQGVIPPSQNTQTQIEKDVGKKRIERTESQCRQWWTHASGTMMTMQLVLCETVCSSAYLIAAQKQMYARLFFKPRKPRLAGKNTVAIFIEYDGL